MLASFANTLWTAANLPAWQHFRRALRDPASIQQSKLTALLKQNSQTAFGQAHHFQKISTYMDFIREVPVSDYSNLEPWINRIRNGEPNILTRDTVTHLIPTSGSNGPRKLIPFTCALQNDFNAAIAPWLVDLARQFPKILGGRAYWSITPSLSDAPSENSKIPIGFDTDTAYLAGPSRALAAAVMAVPTDVARHRSLEAFHAETWRHLRRCRDLRLISVWHPSFLLLLMDRFESTDPKTLWPNLQVISCWADASSSPCLPALQRRFPNVAIQPKGLIATESFVTIPFQDKHPVAVASHFFEFIDPQGAISQLHELRHDHEYEVVVTTSGGLWRYRLGDHVRVTGFLEQTPTLQFLGRGDDTSDLFGEKLSEQFVTKTLCEIFTHNAPAFAMIAPDEDETGCRYTLYIEGATSPSVSDQLDQALRRNPHYAYCRDLGQLHAPKIIAISNAYQTYAAHQSKNGARLGDIKPKSLSRHTGWSNIFFRA